MVFLHQIGLNKDQKGLRMYQQGLNIIMVYGFLDNVCGDFLWYSVVWYSMQWYFVTCGPTLVLLGFGPSGVGTAFEQQTGSFLMLWVYISPMPVVCVGMASYHAMPYGRMWSHTIWEAFSIISSLSLSFDQPCTSMPHGMMWIQTISFRGFLNHFKSGSDFD